MINQLLLDHLKQNNFQPQDSDPRFSFNSPNFKSKIMVKLQPHFEYTVQTQPHCVKMVWMCHGNSSQIINGFPIYLKEGEVLFLSSCTHQEILPCGEEDIAAEIYFRPEFFDLPMRMIGSKSNTINTFLNKSLNSNDPDDSYLYFRAAKFPEAQNLLENLVSSAVFWNVNSWKICQYTLGVLFLIFLTHSEKMTRVYHSFNTEIIARTLQYIEENYRDGQLTELANRLDCEFSWLSRTIKEKIGFTFQELMQQKKISKACELLSETTLPVTTISMAVGYENISYFHSVFKKYYGTTPSRYRIMYADRPL